MATAIKLSLTALRVGLGWLFFYAGIIKVLDPAWSAAPYLARAQTFPEFFLRLASPENIGWVNFVNEWALVLIGFALLVGVEVRLASLLGGILMFLYWLPVLNFPLIGEHSFIIDEHIIYLLALGVLWAAHRDDPRTLKNLLAERSR